MCLGVEPNSEARLNLSAPQTFSALLEESLQQLNMSQGGDKVQDTKQEIQVGEQLSSSPSQTGSSRPSEPVTSTPRMEVSAPLQFSMECTKAGGPCSELNLDTHPDNKVATPVLCLEQRMQRLELTDQPGEMTTGGGEEEPHTVSSQIEVTVCKITSKTKVVFLESRQRKKKVS